MAVSIAALRVLETEAGLDVARDAAFVAGHSLGEYSALAAAGALSIADTARLLRHRGEAMQKAVPIGMGAMAALLGLDYETGVSVAQEASAASGADEICEIANDNGGGQVVASGTKKAVDQAIEIAKGKGARRAMLLSVSAPFHCALMQPAADAMAQALASVDVQLTQSCGCRQRDRASYQGCRRYPPRACRAGDGDGSLARIRRIHGKRQASIALWKSAPARF